MNTNRVLLAVACCAALAACSKKETVKPEAPVETPAVTNTAPVDDGKYDPSDLDTDPCLIKRVVYFDFDQTEIKPEFAA
ncbi:MAG: peptidoglycan-associated lipoprotein, partial [Xanthomonadales bacterium]|nr:peptidoglycan-associated lipoprotein [Xanthomonadales bacterium]